MKTQIVEIYHPQEQVTQEGISPNQANVVEPLICPICNKPNACAVSKGLSIEACWCLSLSARGTISAAVKAQLRGKACVCQSCYESLCKK